MHPRMKLITERGKQILFVDLSNCSADEVQELARKAPDYVTTQPLRSILLLVDFTGASLDAEALRVMKESAVFDKPFIKKSAWLGASYVPKAFHEEISNFSGRDLPSFRTRKEALTWLLEDEK
jgi:hypothetical protein